jgi:hypothetical protein
MDASWNTGYFKSILGYSQYMNDTSNPPNTIGKLDNPSGVTGDGSDDDVTYYETSGWYQNPNYPYNYVGGEALTWGLTSVEYVGWAEFHATAKIGPLSGSNPPWYNRLIIEVSMTANWDDWHYVNYVEVHSNGYADFTVGSIETMFKYITVLSWCPTETLEN